MKKQFFLMISLFIAYYSYGQTHSTCDNAFYLSSDQIDTLIQNEFNGTLWGKFKASNSNMQLRIYDTIPSIKISLYSGTCNHLNKIASSSNNVLTYNKLTPKEEYYFEVLGNNTIPNVNFKLLETPPSGSFCGEIEDCDLIVNGDFSIHSLNNQDNISNGIYGWRSLLGTPQLSGVPSNPRVSFWAYKREDGTYDKESIITCTQLEENALYMYIMDYKKNPYNDNGSVMKMNVLLSSDLQENLWEGISSESYQNSQYLIESTPFNSNNQWLHMVELFQTNESYDRVIIYPQSDNSSPQTALVDNIRIISLEYQDTIYACNDKIEVHPKCQDAYLLNHYDDLINISWQADNGVIIEGGNTLTPKINTAGNPLLTVNITCNGVTYTQNIQVVQPDEGEQVINFVYTTGNDHCNHHDGWIDVTVEGGTAPYTFEWSMTGLDTVVAVIENAPATGGDLENIPQGSYALTVTSSEGCQVYKHKIDVDASNITFHIQTFSTPPNEHCGAVKAININNATEPYTYRWENTSNELVGTTQLVTGLPAGGYSLTLTDANNCQAFKTAIITNNSDALGVIEDDTIYVCQGSNFSFGVSEAYDSYLWNTGETTNSINLNNVGNVNGDPYGDYTCNYKTESGCRFEKTFHILPPVLNIDVDKAGNTCKPNMVSTLERLNISATPGYTNYQWSYRTFTNNGVNFIPIPMNINGNEGRYTFSNYNSGYIVIYLTADVPNSDCQVSTSTKIYIGESVTNNTLLTNNWQDQNLYVFTDIILNDGQTHEINNCHIEFAPECGIKVQGVGTRLKIRNSEIEGMFCADALWDGIIVKGETNTNVITGQLITKKTFQPVVDIQESYISEAKCAISSMNGGIIISHNNTYINNNHSIGLFCRPYWINPPAYYESNNNITNCHFEINSESNLLSDFEFNYFMLVDARSVFSTKYNTFINKCYDKPYDERGTAIKIYNTIRIGALSFNSFERMTNAIKVDHVNFSKISYNQFKNNYRGISAESINVSSSFIGNTFDDTYLKQENSAYQLGLSRLWKPHITENTFKNGVVGVYLDNENYGDFQIYKNTFEGFNLYSNILNGYPTAVLNDATNGTFGSTPKGLEVKCNTFKKYDYAIAIQKGSIKQTQGSNESSQSPAGNRFFDDVNMPDGNFFISDIAKGNMGNDNYKYFYHQSPEEYDLGTTYRYTQPNPNDEKGVKKIEASFEFEEVVSCPSENPTSSTRIFNQQKDSINQQQSLISDKKQDLANKIDKGNTDVLLAEIDMATDANFAALVQEIESVNAYLSDETAIEFIEKPTNRQVAKAVGLIANSPLPEQAKKRLPDMDMDEELKAYIYAHQTGTSKRELDEQRIYQLETKKEALIDQSIRMAYSDTSNVLFPQVIELLLEQNDFDSQLMAYRMLSAKNEQEQAQMVFNDLELMLTPFEEAHQEHLQNYLELLQWQNSLDTLSDSLMVESIKANRVLLEQIKNSNYTEGHSEAYYLLQKAGLLPKDKLAIQLPNPHQRAQNRALNRQPIKALPKSHFKQLADRLEVYPNPVADILTVEYIMFNGLRVNTMGIYDMNGHLLQTHPITKAMGVITIDVKGLPSGTYIIAFGTEGSASGTSFIVK